jgi:CHAT domain-containing protein
VDTEHPLFSALALTPGVEHDGFLTALDVVRMRVPADLVVLSACRTGRGRVFQGEGHLGLARSFMLAGAPRVLTSLWDVDDRATQALMTRLHERWRAGQPLARAFRETQAEVRAHPEWAHPRYWAAWVLWGLPH